MASVRPPRTLASTLLAMALLGGGLAGPLLLASPAMAAELLVDGGLDTTYAPVAGSTNVNDHWDEFDSVYVSPLCTTTDGWCEDGPEGYEADGTAPRSGTGVAWFGLSEVPGSTAYLRQAVTIPAGVSTTLSYWYRNGQVRAPHDATLTVSLDGHVLRVHTEDSAAQATYTQFTADLTSYADGASHTLSFDYLNGPDPGTGPGANNMTIDDISIATDSTAPDTSVSAAPIAKRLTVPVAFAATEAGSTFLCSLDGMPFARVHDTGHPDGEARHACLPGERPRPVRQRRRDAGERDVHGLRLPRVEPGEEAREAPRARGQEAVGARAGSR
jgi:hypothetical protein